MGSATRMPRWRATLSVTALALAAGGLAGGPVAAQSPEPSPVAGAFTCAPDAVAVDFWTEHTPPDSDGLLSIVDAFNEANPDVCVTMTIVPGSETNIAKLLTSIRGGVGPDVYLVDRFTVAQRANEGVVSELPAEAAAMADQYLPFAWAETQFQGATYALPFDTDVRALFYNIDLLEAAGQDPAQLDIANGPLTIDAVDAIADAVTQTDADGNYTQMGWIPGGPGAAGQPGAIDQGWHYTWGYTFGGNFADLEACQVTPTDPGVVAGYQFLHDWAAERDPEKISRFVATVMPDPAQPANQNAFVTGKVAMIITGPWRINQMAQLAPDVNYGFTYIPVPNEGDESATWAGGWAAALIPDSDAPDEAWRFMQFLAGPEGQEIYTVETAHIPTLTALTQDPSLFDEQLAQFLPLLDTAHNRPPLAVGALYWDGLTSAQGAVELNTQEPEAALQQVADSVQPELDVVGC
jgi:multiple sugar transport system substrate-binding protein